MINIWNSLKKWQRRLAYWLFIVMMIVYIAVAIVIIYISLKPSGRVVPGFPIYVSTYENIFKRS